MDVSGDSTLAAAITPAAFVGISGSIKQVTDASKTNNQRVFAEVGDFHCSWGDLQALRDADETVYINVIADNGQNGSAGDSANSIHGLNPTNQKIYFGTDANGDPL